MTEILLITFVFLCAGLLMVPIATQLSLGSVLGYLLAGIAISPVLSGLHVNVMSIQHFAEFGVVMMMFLVGLELEPKALWAKRRLLFGLGGGQILLSALVIMALAIAFGQPWTIALTIGLILALSSTAIVVQTLNERGLLKSEGGQASFAVLLSQDIAVIPMMAILPVLALSTLHGASAETAVEAGAHGSLSLVADLPAWQASLLTLGTIGLVILLGQLFSGPLFRFVAATRLRELLTATALVIVIGIALMMSLVELSPALGTFIGGVVLANSPYRHELESSIDPFKGLLLGIFFMTVGASIDFSLLFANLTDIVVFTVLLIIVKIGVLLLLGPLFGVHGAERWLLALGLAQAGEFGFVMLSFSVTNQVLPQSVADQLLLIVTLSMLLSPLLFLIYQHVIVPRYVSQAVERAETFPGDSKIIIAGSGRVGGIVDRLLRVCQFNPTVIDNNFGRLDTLAKLGIRHFFGDATRPDLLHAAGIGQAKLLIVALDDKTQINELVRHVLRNYPEVHVIARAMDRHHVYDLYAFGCRDIIRETYDASLRIGRSAFEALGVPREKAQRMIDVFYEYDQEVMRAGAETYQVGVPFEENKAYMDWARSVNQRDFEDLRQRLDQVHRS